MKKIGFCADWMYYEGSGSSLGSSLRGSKGGRPVMLPHDASAQLKRNSDEVNGSSNGYFQQVTCHYTKEWTLTPEERDKQIYLEFEGGFQNMAVYVNSAFVGKCPNGYSNFIVDITRFLVFDRPNRLKVVLKGAVPGGRWYTGNGLYRNVNLLVGNRFHLAPEGIHLSTMWIDGQQAQIRASAHVGHEDISMKAAALRLQIIDPDGVVVAENEMPFTVTEHGDAAYQQLLYVPHPQTWSPEHPVLYSYRMQLLSNGAVTDEETGTFGIRTIRLDPQMGLTINGESIKLRGGCVHHDNGILGAVEFPHAARERVRALKRAGYNAIRSSHNPMSKAMLCACDEEGMLVMDEFSDVWTHTKADFDYAMAMTEWWEQDIRRMVDKDYNHPCVIMYSIGNEIREAGNPHNVQWGKKLTDLIRKLDDTRLTTNCLNLMFCITDHMDELMEELQRKRQLGTEILGAKDQEINSLMTDLGTMMEVMIGSDLAGKVTEEAFAQVDVAGYNYGAGRYEIDLKKYPNRFLLGTETYGADLDRNWKMVMGSKRILGDFSWTAWDYLGEAGIGRISYAKQPGLYAAYPYKCGSCGDFDFLGHRNAISYWREIIWGRREAPYLCVQPPRYHGQHKFASRWAFTDAVRSWTWPGEDGKPVTIEIYSSGDQVQLFCNGSLLGSAEVGKEKEGIALFETVYKPGELLAIAIRNGVEIGRDSISTASGEGYIAAVSDREVIPADGSDICYVDIAIQDRNGIPFPNEDAPVRLKVEGPGALVGYGSADPESEQNFFDDVWHPWQGRLKAAIRGTGEPGDIHISLTGDELQPAHLIIKAE